MTKKVKVCGRIDEKEYAITDVAGNPRYDVELYIGEGRSLHGRTAMGSPCNYGNWKEGDGVNAEYHLTKAGSVVFDNIKKQEEPNV